MGTKCCKAAPVPGETKVWQYITLMKRIFLIDCPGVVYDVGDDEVETVLKGVVRAERLETPSDFIQPILDRVKKDYITRQYGIKSWDDAPDFLTQLAQKQGKLLKGGEVDVESISINIINDWQRVSINKLKFYLCYCLLHKLLFSNLLCRVDCLILLLLLVLKAKKTMKMKLKL